MGVYPRKKKDGTVTWIIDYYDLNDRRYREVGGITKTQAQRALQKVKANILDGKFEISKKVNNPLIEDFAKTYLERRKHLRSRKRDDLSVRTLLNFFKSKSLAAISPADIEDYISQRRHQGLANGTINRELACLKRMYSLAIKWGDAKKNPVLDVDFLEEPPGRERFLTEEEGKNLIQCCAEHLKPIVITALNTGMRLGEIINLTWDRVNIDHVIDPYIEVTMTKNNKNRFIPLHGQMVEMFKELREKNKDLKYVFLSIHGKQLQSVKKPFQAAIKRAGISNFRFHDLRHTFASYFVMSGGDLLTLKEILGHSSMQMVERYAHLAAAHKLRQIKNIQGIFTDSHKMDTSTKIIEIKR